MIKQILTVAFSLLVSFAHAQVGIITTFAGTGVTGYSGDGGPATAALFDSPSAICLDKSRENIYITDAFNHVVRKINLSTHIVSTIAGTGFGGYNGDNIPATLAKLFVPDGICIDSLGNIYISDGLNQRVRKVDAATGMITTILGNGTAGFSGDHGPAINAQINIPGGLCLYNGSLFLCDNANNIVRKVDLSSGIATTVAGSALSSGYTGDGGPANAAKFNSPVYVTFDNTGNMFVSDQYNYAIRRVDAVTHIIATIAGTGTGGYSGDGGLATHAKFNEPTGLFVDQHNGLHVADYRNGAIRRIDLTTSIIATVAGGAFGYSGDGGPATNAKLKCTDVCVDNGGNMYITDYVNQRLRKVSGALKINDINVKDALTLYPNPTKGKFIVQTASNQSVITIYNTVGKLIRQITAAKSETEVDISTQPPGTYLVYVQFGEEKYVSKVVIE